MKIVTILANSAAEALAEIHRRLGPDAIIVNIRKTPAPGLSRIWKKPQIEVQATVPERPSAPQETERETFARLNRKLDALQRQVAAPIPEARAMAEPPAPARRPLTAAERPTARPMRSPIPHPGRRAPEPPAPVVASSPGPEWELTRMLENLGVLPLHAQWLVDQVHTQSGGARPGTLREEFALVQEFLLQYWNRLAARAQIAPTGVRALVGAPGVGKSTCLCKWLTQEALLGTQSTRVWRLDGHTANTAEFLSIHGEILGIPVERVWNPELAGGDHGIQFVDLPGVPTDDAVSLESVGKLLREIGPAQVFLVLNAAYDLGHLLAQSRIFSALPITGVILSHLDEETRWSKFWNLLLGAQLPILYLSGGQSIPGQFAPASPQSLFNALMEDPVEAQ